MNNTRTDQTVHIENPMCSATIENHRLRFATRLPVFSQNPGSSGSQWSIHRPPRAGLTGLISVVLIVPPELVGTMSDAKCRLCSLCCCLLQRRELPFTWWGGSGVRPPYVTVSAIECEIWMHRGGVGGSVVA